MGPKPRPLLAFLLLATACAAARGEAEVNSDSSGHLAVGDQVAGEAPGCANTLSGRLYVADDRGWVCSRQDFDHSTGCCVGGEQHLCSSCVGGDNCCTLFEHCVSCCLKPENALPRHKRGLFRGFNKPETGEWGSDFEYCRGICRTHSRSTQHENAYISQRRHCYSRRGRPRVPAPPAPPLPSEVTSVKAGDGQSCDGACAAARRRCAPAHFAALNNCNALRERFLCEAGCGTADPTQREFPGFVVYTAPKPQWPTFCFTLPPPAEGAAPAFNCSIAAGSVQRLCPCEVAPVVAEGQAAAATAGVSDTQQQQQQQPGEGQGAGSTA